MIEINAHPLFFQSIENKQLSISDVYFAKMLLQKVPSPKLRDWAFLAYLFSWYRKGHLCIDLQEKILQKNLKEYIPEFADLVLQGAQNLPKEIIAKDLLPTSASFQPLCQYKTFVYLHKYWVYESEILYALQTIVQRKPPKNNDAFPWKDSPLNEEQKHILFNALVNPMTIICGGPGTGKTFLAAHIAQAFCAKHNKKIRIALAAPTGKAVAHLENTMRSLFASKEKVHIEAKTLHALLQISRKTQHLQQSPPLFYDLVIIDEASMIDAKLFTALFRALHENVQLILLGDPYQLPPVEAGSLFGDIAQILVPYAMSFTLHKNFRFHQTSIDTLSQKIVKNENLNTYLQKKNNHVKFCSMEKFSYQSNLLDIIAPWMIFPSKTPPKKEELQSVSGRFAILSALRRGPFSVQAINELIYSHVLSKVSGSMWVTLPIIITQNDYRLGLYNGMMGYYQFYYEKRRTKTKERFFFFQKENNLIIEHAQIAHFEWAFALSVHKSQGSEYENVFLFLPKESQIFGRELLYTAATRAKSYLQIVAHPETIDALAAKPLLRMSGLETKWKELMMPSELLS